MGKSNFRGAADGNRSRANGTQAYAIDANKESVCPGESKKFYFTFGSDPGFPYQNTYLVVEAVNEKSAIRKFRKKFPDRNINVYNASFCYSQEKWEEYGCEKYYPDGPETIIK